MSKLETVNFQFYQRNARSNGPQSSADMNAMMRELSHDLTTIYGSINDSLVPLTDSLPDGTVDVAVNAWTNGLDAKTIYSDSSATSVVNAGMFNSIKNRPYTIYEHFELISNTINELREYLENKIEDNQSTASSIQINDNAGLFTATTVEDALAEVMTALNALQASIA